MIRFISYEITALILRFISYEIKCLKVTDLSIA